MFCWSLSHFRLFSKNPEGLPHTWYQCRDFFTGLNGNVPGRYPMKEYHLFRYSVPDFVRALLTVSMSKNSSANVFISLGYFTGNPLIGTCSVNAPWKSVPALVPASNYFLQKMYTKTNIVVVNINEIKIVNRFIWKGQKSPGFTILFHISVLVFFFWRGGGAVVLRRKIMSLYG